MKKNIFLRIIAGIGAILLIGFALSTSNAFVGNPFTAMLADRAVKSYVKQKYSFLDLEIEKAKYDFKNSSYVSKVKSKSSVDTHFSIYYDNGKVHGDSYDFDVMSMFNTLERLSQEYSALAKSIVANKLNYVNNSVTVTYGKNAYENPDKALKLDMKFDKSLPLEPEVTLHLDLRDNSANSIAKILTDAHRVFIDNGCNFSKYSLYSENRDVLVMVNEVTPQDIESSELEKLLDEARDNRDTARIYFYIKEDKK